MSTFAIFSLLKLTLLQVHWQVLCLTLEINDAIQQVNDIKLELNTAKRATV